MSAIMYDVLVVTETGAYERYFNVPAVIQNAFLSILDGDWAKYATYLPGEYIKVTVKPC